jgi:hypothetical protein
MDKKENTRHNADSARQKHRNSGFLNFILNQQLESGLPRQNEEGTIRMDNS